MGSLFRRLRCLLAIRKDQMMEFLLGGIGVVICIGLALKGHLLALIIGGILGSFVGVAGFGGAVSGILPGAIVGALVAISIKKKSP